MSRKGKIARLPLAIREELNQRLLEGQSGGKILPWLNARPEVQAILAEDFEGLRVNDNNLSEWRRGGYAEWIARRERLDSTRELARFAADITIPSSTPLVKAKSQSPSQSAVFESSSRPV